MNLANSLIVLTLNYHNHSKINNLPLWHECQKHLTIHNVSNSLKYNTTIVRHIYKNSKFCEELYTSKICNSPWVNVALLYPKLLMLDLTHVDSDSFICALAFHSSFIFFVSLFCLTPPFTCLPLQLKFPFGLLISPPFYLCQRVYTLYLARKFLLTSMTIF